VLGLLVSFRVIRQDHTRAHKYVDGVQVYRYGFEFWFLRIVWLVCSLAVRPDLIAPS